MKKIQIFVWSFLIVITILTLVFIRFETKPVWIQTDKEQYLIGEEVIIYFTNNSNKTIEKGYWGIEGVCDAVRGRILMLLDPGESFSWTWDQAYCWTWDQAYLDRRLVLVPPGKYTVYWTPYKFYGVMEAIDTLTYEFEILDRVRDNES